VLVSDADCLAIQTAMDWDEWHPSICGKVSKGEKGSMRSEITEASGHVVAETGDKARLLGDEVIRSETIALLRGS